MRAPNWTVSGRFHDFDFLTAMLITFLTYNVLASLLIAPQQYRLRSTAALKRRYSQPYTHLNDQRYNGTPNPQRQGVVSQTKNSTSTVRKSHRRGSRSRSTMLETWVMVRRKASSRSTACPIGALLFHRLLSTPTSKA